MAEAELQRLAEEKIIEPVQLAEWAAPIVPVKKPDGSIQICGGYKLTVNRASSVKQYPIPKVEDLFAQLPGVQQFSKLDRVQRLLTHARDFTITVGCLLEWCRVQPFFQSTMEGILQNMKHVTVYLDYILVLSYRRRC